MTNASLDPLPATRMSTGVPGLDAQLGGGLLPGRLTVVLGAAGAGKTQFGLQWAFAGSRQEGSRGVVLDLASRGDAQSHAQYAQGMFRWEMENAATTAGPLDASFYDPDRRHGDYLQVFAGAGRHASRRRLDFGQQRLWQAELNQKLQAVVAFVYGRLAQGSRRIVVDGVEPVETPTDSVQLDLFEYVHHQILQKDPEWVARDLFRQDYRALAELAARRRYDPRTAACMLLLTSRESLLSDLISRSLDEGDALCNANTVILMGRVLDGQRLRRGLYIAKHRGSACSEEILAYTIDDQGIRLSPPGAPPPGA